MNKLNDETKDFVLGTFMARTVKSMDAYFSEASKLMEVSANIDDTVLRVKGCYFNRYNDIPIIFDSGASTSVSPIKEDFIDMIPMSKHLNGLNGGAEVIGQGTIWWTVYSDSGKQMVIETQAYYVPTTSVRLFSPVPYFRQSSSKGGDGKFCLDEYGARFHFPHSMETITLALPDNALPSVFPITTPSSNDDNAAFLSVLDESNIHLTNAQKQLLLWHQRIGHYGLQRIQSLFRPQYGREPRLESTTKLSSCEIPKCEACLTSKATKRPNQSQLVQNVEQRQGILRRDHMKPGDMISVDQYESTVCGRLPNSFGKKPLHQKYCGGTIYVDHTSIYIFAYNQVTLGAGDTIRGKSAFKYMARQHGITNSRRSFGK
jgi:hypothetical protein